MGKKDNGSIYWKNETILKKWLLLGRIKQQMHHFIKENNRELWRI